MVYVAVNLFIFVQWMSVWQGWCAEREDTMVVSVSMPPVSTEKKGEYVCYARPIDEIDNGYLAGSYIDADPEAVHHVSIGVCEAPASTTNLWKCSQTHLKGSNCNGAAINFVGWDDMIQRHDEFKPPKELSVRVGRKAPYKYLLIEVHFNDPVTDPEESVANVTIEISKTPGELFYQSYLLLSSGYIPANTGHGFFSEIACPWRRSTVYAYRYYLHTHHNGLLVEGYIVRNGTWTLIGSQLSVNQPKETYEIPGGPIEIRQGDVLTARCLYANAGSGKIDFGLRSEMCNFNIEFGYKASDEDAFLRPLGCMTDSPGFSFCDHEKTSGICG